MKDYIEDTKGRLTLHFLPGYAPELNPDELVWSHIKRTGAARAPLRVGERLRDIVRRTGKSRGVVRQVVRGGRAEFPQSDEFTRSLH